MKIFKVDRTDDWSYDDYDSFVCFANTADEASRLNPDGYRTWRDGKCYFQYADGTEKEDNFSSWTSPDKVKVWELNPLDDKPYIILSSFNAG